MARGLLQTLNQLAREAERAQKARHRQLAAEEQAQKRFHATSRADSVEQRNALLQEQLAQLDGILVHALAVDNYLNLDVLKHLLQIPRFEPGALADEGLPPMASEFRPVTPGFFKRLLPGTNKDHKLALARAQDQYRAAARAHKTSEAARKKRLAEARALYTADVERMKKIVAKQHRQVDSVKAELAARNPETIASYFSTALERSAYPDEFPQKVRVAYVPESKQLVIEYELPTFAVVPQVKEYKYIKTKDSVSEVMRSAADRKRIYSGVVCQITIRTLHEVFQTDRLKCVETVVFNGHVSSIDAATGQNVRPCVISVRTTRGVFDALELRRVDPVACLTALNASISKKPDELVPIRPVLEFNMVDRRFVQEADVLSGLDSRPNLMELTPSEFESLITNLFSRMRLEKRQTQASRDGGVDCVAFDPRPIFGGKVVIQAKRYKNTVGVSAVRDLFGTLQNEGASKGILVTTSGFGKASFEFAEGKPIELLSGSNLLFLLAEHAGIEAKIIMPDDWSDAPRDAGI